MSGVRVHMAKAFSENKNSIQSEIKSNLIEYINIHIVLLLGSLIRPLPHMLKNSLGQWI